MPNFPRTEAEIVVLAETMVAGYTAHPVDFPSTDTSAVLDLSATLNNYQTDKQTQTDTKAQAKIATETKVEKLDTLTELMKNDLKLSEVDVADNPEKLAQIGWGLRQTPQPVPAPGQPNNLHPVAEKDRECSGWRGTDPHREGRLETTSSNEENSPPVAVSSAPGLSWAQH